MSDPTKADASDCICPGGLGQAVEDQHPACPWHRGGAKADAYTEKDLRLAEQLWQLLIPEPEGQQHGVFLVNAAELLAAFRAEARREDLGRLVDESTQNGYEAGRTAEREACERIVGEELGEMVKLGAEEVWPEACLNAILCRLRERAK